VRFTEHQARRYMELAKSATVAELQDAWRQITGRADEAAALALMPGS
jgi:hypothetical protein